MGGLTRGEESVVPEGRKTRRHPVRWRTPCGSAWVTVSVSLGFLEREEGGEGEVGCGAQFVCEVDDGGVGTDFIQRIQEDAPSWSDGS